MPLSKKTSTVAVNNFAAGLLEPEIVEIDSLTEDPDNARLHPQRNIEAVMDSVRRHGQRSLVIVRRENRVVAKGNGTLVALRRLGWTRIAASFQSMTDEEFHDYALADNRSSELAEWDAEVVARLQRLHESTGGCRVGWSDEDVKILRAAEWEQSIEIVPSVPNLSERFIVPPFSVLDARQGYWQERKRQWLALGIQSELGRGEDLGGYNIATEEEAGSKGLSAWLKARIDHQKAARSHYRANATPGGSLLPAATLGKDGRTVRGDGKGRPLARTFGSGAPGDLAAGFKQKTLGAIAPNQGGANGILTRTGRYAPGAASPYNCYNDKDDTSRRNAAAQPQSGTSIFDPVLCELVYRWFSPPTGVVFDPFAGGSVRGIVAAKLGRKYTGIDLRPEQAAVNVVQAEKICPENLPRWVVGDAVDIDEMRKAKRLPQRCDVVFSCPPYYDLERYSDDPRDLSTMSYDQFLEVYQNIIAMSCAMLIDNRFACFVVGDIRDRATGNYRGFVGNTIEAFRMAGLSLYNEAILVTAVGSLPIRVGKQFSSYRKLGKTHQQCLVFLKGDAKKAVEACGPVEVGDLAELLNTEEMDAGVADE